MDSLNLAEPARWRTGLPRRSIARTPVARAVPWLAGGMLPALLTLPVLAGDVILNELMYHPASHRADEEWIELHNRGTATVDVGGWRLTAGVDLTLPPALIAPGGFLVVAADAAAFARLHPQATAPVAGWQGRLSDSGETVTLRDALGVVQDSVTYATEGDWAIRRRGPDDRGHRGWEWFAAHDGAGASLERIQAHIPGASGQNWAASTVAGGTPGAPNSTAATPLPPLISEVRHHPAVPRSTDPVHVTARVANPGPGPVQVVLHHRTDGAAEFTPTAMADDGAHADGPAADGVFGARIAALPQDTIVEFYVEARDAAGRSRTWPAPVDGGEGQAANCLYMVDDRPYTAPQPLYRVILTAAEQAELAAIDALPWYWSSNAEMNATFIRSEDDETEVRYTTGFRLRGTTSRAEPVKGRRINFNTDHRWQGVRAINLNAVNPHSQVAGSVLARRAGLPAARARAVQLRENNQQRAPSGFPPFGVYAEVEVLNSDFADRQYPADGAGNLYQAIGKGNLDYLDDPALYRSPEYYEKLTNAAEDDWTDLIGLTAVLNLTPPDRWFDELTRVADISSWVTYFAVNAVLANTESGLGTGGPGDYAMYRGAQDPRFRLVIHDLDSLLGTSGGVDQPLLRATNNPAIHRFLTTPEVAPLYFAELRRLVDRDLTPATVEEQLRQTLGDFVPAATIQAMAGAYRTRVESIRTQLPASLATHASLPVVEGLQVTTNTTTPLAGTADRARTRAVTVDSQPAAWDPVTGAWSIDALPLLPGVNRIVVRCLDAAGTAVDEQIVRVWCRSGPYREVSGTLPGDTTWSATNGPFVVTGDLTIPAGTSLTIEPGTTVFFWSNRRLLVQGRLDVGGTGPRRVHLGREPGAAYAWGGIRMEGTPASRLRQVDVAWHGDPALYLTNSSVLVEDTTFIGSFGNVLWGQNSSMVVRRCEFPDLPYGEHVRGDHLPPDGEWLFEENIFGTTTGYSDIIDVSGGQRPGPVLQVLNNVFRGGSDDGLDLDGTEAHIEGNVFMHFRKQNTSTSEASAISTGVYDGRSSDLVIVRNVFLDNDHDLVLKEGSRVLAANNTFAGSVKASVLVNEPERPWESPPEGGLFEDCLFWNTPAVVGNLDPALLANGTIQLEVRRSLVPATGPWAGPDNLVADPRFVAFPDDLRLQPGSPAQAAGSLGQDLGAYVPAGAILAGTPAPATWRREATLAVGGPGLTHFRWRLDAGDWSAPLAVGTPVTLAGLTEGPHQVFAVGLNSAGVWQPLESPTASPAWTVAPGAAGLRLSEVCAWNRSAWPVDGRFPDYVELHNDGPVAVDLAGLSLTDDLLDPRRFVFQTGTQLAPGGHLVVQLIPGAAVGPSVADFGLDHSGDAIHLVDRPGGRGTLATVSFGPQLPDFSIGDRGDGVWTLTLPTPGAPNRAQALGDPAQVRLSEWLARPGPLWGDDFVELFNTDTLPVRVDGLRLTPDPVGLPAGVPLGPLGFIAPRGYSVYRADGDAPWSGAEGGHLPFRLEGEQGVLALLDANGGWQDWIAYGPQTEGVSQGRPPGGSLAVVTFPVPTPGTAFAVLPGQGQVVISEVLAHNVTLTNASGAASDWVELANPGTEPVSLAGLSLSDRLDEPGKWVFPAGTLLAPGGFLVIRCESALPPSATNTGFGLSAEGESLYLFDGAGVDAGLLDSVSFGPQAADLSLARRPDQGDVWALSRPTPGAANEPVALADPAVLRVNEWMASPAAGPDWLEIVNPGPDPVALDGLLLSDSVSNPAKYAFPDHSFVAPGPHGFVVLFADEKPAAGPAHLPFKLSADGETIRLSRADRSLIDSVEFGAQRSDVSEGRYPDAAAATRTLTVGGSPGSANSLNARPVIFDIADQSPAAGQPWSLVVQAFDPDPGQTLSLRLQPPVPAGLELDPASRTLRWLPSLDQISLRYEVTVVALDSGDPAQEGTRRFTIRVLDDEPPPAWNPVWLDAAGQLHLSWSTRPGSRYAVDAAGDPAGGAWVNQLEVVASGTSVELTVPVAGAAHRFFRVRRLP